MKRGAPLLLVWLLLGGPAEADETGVEIAVHDLLEEDVLRDKQAVLEIATTIVRYRLGEAGLRQQLMLTARDLGASWLVEGSRDVVDLEERGRLVMEIRKSDAGITDMHLEYRQVPERPLPDTLQCPSGESVAALSKRLASEVFPDFAPNLETWKPWVRDAADGILQVSYVPEELIFAGSPVIVLEKADCRVALIYFHD